MTSRLLAFFFALGLLADAAATQEKVIAVEQIEALSEEVVTGDTQATVPEPSSTFFAGLGGLTLLLFLRRRSGR